MSRTKIIAGNWKMNKTLSEGIALVNAIISDAPVNSAVKIFFPPFPLIASISEITNGKSNFYTGAQNSSQHASGAYTGEVSAAMLKSVGVKYVLVGHSERRQYFSENNEICRLKIRQALDNGLISVYCVGETLAQRKSGQHFTIIQQQITEALSGISESELSGLVIAYEPVWAIGTGETASPEQAQEVHAFIRRIVAEQYSKKMADELPILYGGSCNAQNAKELFACPDIDGGLIGGASLKADDFCKIIGSI